VRAIYVRLRHEPAWAIRLTPRESESYRNAKLLKRFEVVSGQKIEGRWFLKELRIEELNPGTGKVKTLTYLDIKK
jgi:hypothetical protein